MRLFPVRHAHALGQLLIGHAVEERIEPGPPEDPDPDRFVLAQPARQADRSFFGVGGVEPPVDPDPAPVRRSPFDPDPVLADSPFDPISGFDPGSPFDVSPEPLPADDRESVA